MHHTEDRHAEDRQIARFLSAADVALFARIAGTSHSLRATEPLPTEVGQGRTFTTRFTARRVYAFAKLSGDNNPIHLKPKVAAQTAFGRTVVHGVLPLSNLVTMVRHHIPGRITALAVRFKKPVFVGSEVEFSFGIVEKLSGGSVRVGFSGVTAGKLKEGGMGLVVALTGNLDIDPAEREASNPMLSVALLSCLLGTKFPGPGTIFMGAELNFHRAIADDSSVAVRWLSAVGEPHERGLLMGIDVQVEAVDGPALVSGKVDVLHNQQLAKLIADNSPKPRSRRARTTAARAA